MKEDITTDFPEDFICRINKGCEEFKKVISKDSEAQRLKEIIEFNLDKVDHTTYENLGKIISGIYGNDVATTILIPMQNYGNPSFIREFEKIIGNKDIKELIKGFYAIYGLKIKKAFEMNIHPEQWSNINTSYIKSVDGPIALQHRVIKYDGSLVHFNSDVNSTIILINHLLRHMSNIEDIEELKMINLEEFNKMEEEMNEIKEKISIKTEG